MNKEKTITVDLMEFVTDSIKDKLLKEFQKQYPHYEIVCWNFSEYEAGAVDIVVKDKTVSSTKQLQ